MCNRKLQSDRWLPTFTAVGLLLAILTLVPSSHQLCYPQEICICEPDSAQCKVCNPLQLEQGLGCIGVNLTFDGDKLHTTGSTNFSKWTDFEVVHPGPNNPVMPASGNHYLRSTSGFGQLNFTGGATVYTNNQGRLYGLDFACASPKRKSRTAVPCNVTLDGNIAVVNATSFELVNITASFGNYSYTPGQERYASMSSPYISGGYVLPPEYTALPGFPLAVFFYTFNAVGADGKPVWLYLDNVLYAAFTFG